MLRAPVLNFVAGNHAVRSATVQSEAVLLSVDAGFHLHHSSFRLDKASHARSLGPRRAWPGQSHALMWNVQHQLVVHENGGRQIAFSLTAGKNILLTHNCHGRCALKIERHAADLEPRELYFDLGYAVF